MLLLLKLSWRDWVMLVLAAGYAGVYLLWPSPKTIVETTVEFKDREVIKYVDKIVEKRVIEFRDRVVTKLVEKPDGTRTTTTIVDKSKEQSEVTTNTESLVTVKETEIKEVQHVVANTVRKYSLGVLVRPVDIWDYTQGWDFGVRGAFRVSDLLSVSVSSSVRTFQPTLGLEIHF